MTRIFTVLTLIILQSCIMQSTFSQKTQTSKAFTAPVLSKYANQLNDFTPDNWEITDRIFGDLNKDGVDDVALILEYQDSLKIERGYIYPRILVVAFKARDGYELKLQHNTLLERSEIIDGNYVEEDDPFDSMEIVNGVLKLHFKWDNRGSLALIQYVIRYQSNNLYLIGATLSNGYREDSTISDFNFSTGKYTIDQFHNERSEYRNKRKLPVNTIKKLSEIQYPGSWNIPGIVDGI